MPSWGVRAPKVALADGLDVELQVPEIVTKVSRARGVLQGQRMRRELILPSRSDMYVMNIALTNTTGGRNA